MIRYEIVIKDENDQNDNNTLSGRQDFVNLARRFNLNVKTIAAIVLRLPSTKKVSKDEARRIFEGNSTGIKRYPFIVSVRVAGRFVCAGSLVHESLALSAASCLMRPSDLNAHVQIRVASDFVSKMGYLINIDELIFHPQFDRKTLANNLVLLRTKKALRFRQQPVAAIQYDMAAESALKPSVKNVVILGWGRRKTDEADLREEDRPLSEAKVELYDFNACQYIYTKDFVTDKAFCAGSVDRGAGACNHDAGGPALVDNVLVGVISFGSPHCGAAEAPTVFTRLSPYDEWIESVFQKLAQNLEITSQANELKDYTENHEIPDIDEAMKDVYREHYNVNDVLYGPIETLDENENPIVIKQSFLRYFPSDRSLFPNPEFVANLPQSETPKPITPKIPDEYWRDVPSNEQTDPTPENYAPEDQFDTTTMATMTTNIAYGSQGIYEDIDGSTNEHTATETSLSENHFDNTLNDIKTNPEEICAI
ncbi:trypsin-like [Cydia fagiglandana]|uniref:trypsin-like n=1 Tax=Cydia fagiglandana TaxID=1458189 RepID=UPI002FEE2DFF